MAELVDEWMDYISGCVDDKKHHHLIDFAEGDCSWENEDTDGIQFQEAVLRTDWERAPVSWDARGKRRKI